MTQWTMSDVFIFLQHQLSTFHRALKSIYLWCIRIFSFFHYRRQGFGNLEPYGPNSKTGLEIAPDRNGKIFGSEPCQPCANRRWYRAPALWRLSGWIPIWHLEIHWKKLNLGEGGGLAIGPGGASCVGCWRRSVQTSRWESLTLLKILERKFTKIYEYFTLRTVVHLFFIDKIKLCK